jgi:hypothetical protein
LQSLAVEARAPRERYSSFGGSEHALGERAVDSTDHALSYSAVVTSGIMEHAVCSAKAVVISGSKDQALCESASTDHALGSAKVRWKSSAERSTHSE